MTESRLEGAWGWGGGDTGSGGTEINKCGRENFREWGLHSLPWPWWRFHGHHMYNLVNILIPMNCTF